MAVCVTFRNVISQLKAEIYQNLSPWINNMQLKDSDACIFCIPSLNPKPPIDHGTWAHRPSYIFR